MGMTFLGFCFLGDWRHIYGVPIFESSNKLLPVDTTATLIVAITWGFALETRALEDFTTIILPSRRRSLPSWTWCDWTYASPSVHSIEWKGDILGQGYMGKDTDILHDQKLSLEFENGTIIPWSHEADVADLAQTIMLMENVRYVHVFGPLTHLPIPIHSNPEWGREVCGPYVTDEAVMYWLSRLARDRGMNVTDNEEYVFKAWVYASGIESYSRREKPGRIVYMMLLDETSDSNTFERIDVREFEVQLEWEEEEWREKNLEDLGKMLGWEWKAFKLAKFYRYFRACEEIIMLRFRQKVWVRCKREVIFTIKLSIKSW